MIKECVMDNLNAWKVIGGEVKIRKGAKAPWMELTVTGKRGGKPVVVKMIAKEVDEFISERAQGLGFDEE